MQYDPTKDALFHPELQPSILTDNLEWTHHAICAELSRLAYWHYEDGGQVLGEFKSILANAHFGQLKLFVNSGTSTQGFAVVKDGTAYIAFRGTQPDDITDVLIDGSFIPLAWKGVGLVHDGFLRSYESIANTLEGWLATCQASNVYFTGHSLGAAVATLAAALLHNSHLVTFGSPRVGNAEFAGIFNERDVARYVNCADIVPHLPPQSLSYVHLQGERYFDRNGTLTNAIDSGKIFIDQTTAKAEYLFEDAWKSENVGFRSMADHAPVNYVSAVLGVRRP